MIYDNYNNNYYFKTYYYLPESCVEDKFNKELYKIWASHGELKLTKGNVVDYNYITNDLKYWCEQLNIRKIAYDEWNSTQWALQCKEEGLPITAFSQAIGNFNRGTKEFERLILSGNAFIDRNNISRFCFDNVELRVDVNGNSKPSKEVSQKKIDGVIAMIQALGIYLLDTHGTGEIIVF
jgi:phage terminase large subunit-like protein